MKKLTVLLIMLIIVSQIPICPFAYEATDDEKAAIACALNYFNTYCVNVYFNNNDDDLFVHTIGHLDDDSDLRKEILEKAKEYEDEIKENHYYYFPNELSSALDDDPAKDSLALQYDNTPIEDVISSFPVFIKKKAQYKAAYNRYHNFKSGSGMYLITPESVTVSESGFAYINFGDCVRFLLYKYKPANQVEIYGGWIICDIFEDGDSFGSKYRFDAENMDVEKELLSAGISPSPESESTEPSSEVKAGKETDNSPKENEPAKESEPINYTPWVICTVEAVAIIALVIALVLKKKK